jgi:hypothetical protein
MRFRHLLDAHRRARTARQRRFLRQFSPTLQALEKRRLLSIDASNASYTTPFDVTLSDSLASCVSDSVVESLAFQRLSKPADGLVTLNSDGSLQYTPAPGFHGSDSFTYDVTNGTSTSNPATVNITVENQLPTASDASFSDELGASQIFTSSLSSDVGGGSAALTFALVDGAREGTVALDPTTGSFTYAPSTEFTGTDSFTYDVTDGTLISTTATATIYVGMEAPQVASSTFRDDRALYDETYASQLPFGSGGIRAPATFTYLQLSKPTNGTLALQADGAFDYTPTNDFQGTDSFTYEVSDGTSVSAPATATIDVQLGVPQVSPTTFTVNPGQAFTSWCA